MFAFVKNSLGRKLLAAVGLPSFLIALSAGLWLEVETHAQAPGLGAVSHLILASLVVASVALAGVHLLAVRLLVGKPLARLSAGMKRAREGDFLHRVEAESDDELGALARSFNAMLAAITDLHARRIEDEQSIASMQRELALKAQVEAQHRLLDDTNRRLSASLKELTLLFDLARTLNSTLQPSELYHFVTELLGRNLGYNAFALLVLDDRAGDLVVKSTFGMAPELEGTRLALGEGAAGWAAREKQLLLIRDTRTDPRRPHDRWTGGGDGSFLAVPMLFEGACIGILDFFRPVVDAFSQDEVRLLQSVASLAAMAIANARLHQKTVQLSLTDPLTGVHNRRSLFGRLELEIDRAERFNHALAIAMIDVDHFKRYNDVFGHLAGDGVLKRVAAVLGGAVRKVDLLARYGGEEFALVLPRADRAAALAAAEKLRLLVEESPFEHGDRQPGGRLTISVGIASYPEDARELATLVDSADAALYAAKRAGRNSVCAYADGMRDDPGRRRDVHVTAQPEPGGAA